MSIGRIVARYGLGAIRINRATIQLIRFCLDVPLGYPRCCQPPICSCANWVDAVHTDADVAAGVPPCDWLLPHVSEGAPSHSRDYTARGTAHTSPRCPPPAAHHRVMAPNHLQPFCRNGPQACFPWPRGCPRA